MNSILSCCMLRLKGPWLFRAHVNIPPRGGARHSEISVLKSKVWAVPFLASLPSSTSRALKHHLQPWKGAASYLASVRHARSFPLIQYVGSWLLCGAEPAHLCENTCKQQYGCCIDGGRQSVIRKCVCSCTSIEVHTWGGRMHSDRWSKEQWCNRSQSFVRIPH